MLLAVSYSLLAVAFIVVTLRIFLRLGLRNGISSDDYTIVASLVSRNVACRLTWTTSNLSVGDRHYRGGVFEQTGH